MLGLSRIQIKRAIIIIGALVAVQVLLAQGNVRFFSIVQQVCREYRVTAVMDNMAMLENDEGGTDFNLILNSRRNFHEQTLLIGYIAAGQAMAQTGQRLDNITVMISIPSADNMSYLTTARGTQVDSLRTGRLAPSLFIRQIQYN